MKTASDRVLGKDIDFNVSDLNSFDVMNTKL